MNNLLFLGRDGNLINDILRINNIKVSGIVADKVTEEKIKFFGSAYSIGKKLNIPVITQYDFCLNSDKYLRDTFKDIEIIFMQGYHFRIKNELCNNKRIKIINFHQSLLPKYAGRHPLNWAIINGEKLTGITFHYINEKFDEGDIILQRMIGISEKDNIITLYNKTINAASSSLGKLFRLIFDKKFIPIEQDLELQEYYRPRSFEDGEILYTDTINQIKNKIRALAAPYPGAFVRLGAKRIIIDGLRKIDNYKKFPKIDFVDRVNNNIILKSKDGVLFSVKIRK